MNVAAISRKSARNLLALFTALVAVAAVSASPAAAADGSLLGCGYQPVHPFMRFLDPLPYSLLPGGDFESGAQGWSLSGGARVVSGNESSFVTSAQDSHSLLLPPGSSATSPPMCMGLVLPIVRYFSTGGAALSTCGSRRSTRMLRGASARWICFPWGCPRSRGRRACRRCS